MSETLRGTVIVTGALGGLGYLLTRSLSAAGLSVIAVDNLDPGSEPLELKRHRLKSLADKFGLSVHLADVRSREFASLLMGADAPHTMFHAAGHSAMKMGFSDSALMGEALQETTRTLCSMLSTTSNSRIALFHHVSSGPEDIRLEHEPWAELLRAESELHGELAGVEGVTFIELPALVGPGQSSADPPLRTLVQLISRVPVVLPDPDIAVLATDPSALVEEMVESYLAGEPISELSLRSFAVPPVRDLADAFAEILELPSLGVASRSLPPWGPEAPDSAPRADARTLAARLIESLPTLPHLPPIDWPFEGRRRPRKQSKPDERTR